MITGFEEITEPLTETEETVFLPPIIKGLRLKIGRHNAVTNKDIVRGLKKNLGINISEARVRKIINHIRNNDLVPCLIATSKGYYIAETQQEVDDYIDSLKGRLDAITAVAKSMSRQRQMRWPSSLSLFPNL